MADDWIERLDSLQAGVWHRPGEVGKYDREGWRTFQGGDVCLGCSDPDYGLWVPVSQCPLALAMLDEEDRALNFYA